MNTFQYQVQISQRLISSFCGCTSIGIEQNLEIVTQVSEKLKGIAVKLSVLERYDVSFRQLLDTTSFLYIIDAEYNRLDYWLKEQLQEGAIQQSDLSRLRITVQTARADARDQLSNLRDLGVKVLLVQGHQNYLSGIKLVDPLKNMALLFEEFDNVVMLGIGNRAKHKLESLLGYKLQSSLILELLGYQSIEGSNVWTYFAGSKLSEEADAYLKRRNGKGNQKFILQSFEDLAQLSKQHSLVLFLDCHDKFHYLYHLLELEHYTH